MINEISADHPGGNIIVDKIEGNDVFVHQDLRDTDGWWFYWCFLVSGRGVITFHFTNGCVVSPFGI